MNPQADEYINSVLARLSAMSDADGTFRVSWNELKRFCPNLLKFCGGLASTFPTTATVESDFSRLRREKDRHRLSLQDFGLEAVLQCGSYEELNMFLQVSKTMMSIVYINVYSNQCL
jgi:hypothetical protein